MAQAKLQTIEIFVKVLEQITLELSGLESNYRETMPQDEHARNALQVQIDQLITKQKEVRK